MMHFFDKSSSRVPADFIDSLRHGESRAFFHMFIYSAAQPFKPRAWRSISSTTISNISPRVAQYSSTFHGSLVW